MDTEKTVLTSISTSYTPKWTPVEAIREILQNYLDVRSTDVRGYVRCGAGWGRTADWGRGLEMRHLAMGISEKPAGAKGKYGEGLKLALLVLARMGRKCEIKTRGMRIVPCITMHPDFGCEVLAYNVSTMGGTTQGKDRPGTVVRFECSDEEFHEAQRFFIEFSANKDAGGFQWVTKGKISLPAGNIWVNGTIVGHVDNALFSYHLTEVAGGPCYGNRDRDAINYDLVWSAVQDMLHNTGSRIVRRAIFRDTSHWESQRALDSWRIPLMNRKSWLVDARWAYGKGYLSGGDSSEDEQAKYMGFTVISTGGMTWHRESLLKNLGFPTVALLRKRLAQATKGKPVKITPEEAETLGRAMEFIERYYRPVGTVEVMRTLKLPGSDAKVYGEYDPKTDTTRLLRERLASLTDTISTLLHECVHKQSGYDDCTSEFEAALLAVSCGIINRQEGL